MNIAIYDISRFLRVQVSGFGIKPWKSRRWEERVLDKRVASILFFLLFLVFSVVAETIAPGFGVTWNYLADPPEPETNIRIYNSDERQIGSISADGTVSITENASLDESGAGLVFIIEYITNVSGMHKLSYKVSPFVNAVTGSSVGYTMDYMMISSNPSLHVEESLEVGSDSRTTYPESGEYATRFSVPSGLEESVTVYILFFTTVDVDELTVGMNISTVTIVKESP